jgi:hypothetical protein
MKLQPRLGGVPVAWLTQPICWFPIWLFLTTMAVHPNKDTPSCHAGLLMGKSADRAEKASGRRDAKNIIKHPKVFHRKLRVSQLHGNVKSIDRPTMDCEVDNGHGDALLINVGDPISRVPTGAIASQGEPAEIDHHVIRLHEDCGRCNREWTRIDANRI